ncbi:HD domain-containing protein [Dethiosulfatarculus sandiegensis]|uniref:Phosphohydrolase n=1 Tax=Dethiosulfatarculus sandiegensis TaxID=1429043 RepID=A0A0D2GKQ4_9BACT|nr:HD domain-containing protein [Dethiosulfatarculus sandiegensis]KIX15332.1 phosphohydrolase [Dethiosulfatarculus sandiegensis]
MNLWQQDKFITAWRFACQAHQGQALPGTELPYVNHLANVAMEVMSAIACDPQVANPDLAVQCALLHDTIEDTQIVHVDLAERFGIAVADGVQALSKNKKVGNKKTQMKDSLDRIQRQPREVWMVKLADRITNLQTPPGHWSMDKIAAYHDEAKLILTCLRPANEFLGTRLEKKIEAYTRFVCTKPSLAQQG